MTDAVLRLVYDLRDAGVCEDDVARLTGLYDRALDGGTKVEWRRLYRGIFLALRRNAGSHGPRSRDALESLLRLLEDDLGRELFGADAVARLRARIDGPVAALSFADMRN